MIIFKELIKYKKIWGINIMKEQILSIILEAGKIIAKSKVSKDMIIKKGLADFVTHVDLEVQNYIINALKSISPDSNIITEESNNNDYNLHKDTWILDPVDGTANLMHGFNHSAISLALFVDSKPKMGIVYNPFIKEMFYAESGKGAYLNDKNISVSPQNDMERCYIAFGTNPYNKSASNRWFPKLQKVFMECQDLKRTGSAALDLCYVACGRTEGYFEENLKPWDFAAGTIILKEAGGVTTDFSGNTIDFLKPQDILASNGLIHKKMISLLNTTQ